MPILDRAPTVRETTDAFREWLSPIIEEAGGRDGRVSLASAQRISERRDAGRLAAANAVRVMEESGQRTMSARKLIGLEVERLEAAAVAVAGPNQRLSLVEIQNLPAELAPEILHLRGRGNVVERPPRTPEQTAAAVTALVTAALDGGTAQRLPGPPFGVRGRRPVVENIPHPASNTRAIAYMIADTVYISRASPVPSPLVGWYRIGDLAD